MHRSSLRPTLFAAFVAVIVLLMAALPALATQDGEQVSTQFSATQITWQPQTAFGSADLVISSPTGDIEHYRFAAGDAPVWSIFETTALEPVDGSYTWELRLAPPGRLLERSSDEARTPGADAAPHSGGSVSSGSFTIAGGQVVIPTLEPEVSTKNEELSVAPKDQLILDDLIVDGSLCAGLDCVNGESFGFDVLKLKETTVRLGFQDTSGAGFPANDWQLTINDRLSGGANKFAIDDLTSGQTPFTLTAGAPSNSIFVDPAGEVGLGTSVPAVELHIVDGDSPTVRLEQDGSAGFGTQTWELTGNETNFFIEDVTNGSALPFRIRPGASSNSIYIENNDNVGIGTNSPDAPLEVYRSDGSARILINADSGATTERTLINAVNRGKTRVTLSRTDLAGTAGADWSFAHGGNNFEITKTGTGVQELTLNASTGDLSIMGDFVSSGTSLNVPDYVFADDYPLMPLDQLAAFIAAENHLPNIPSAAEINGSTLNITQMQMKLLEKVEELTLYTLQLDQRNKEQASTIAGLKAELEALREAR